MSDHALAEGLAGLASRIDSLSQLAEGRDKEALKVDADRVTKLLLVAIARDMDATNAQYQDAVNQVAAATGAIGDADKKVQKVADTIAMVAKALDVAEKVLKKAAGV
jgi:ABC-type transporter Mla subunit MlaD